MSLARMAAPAILAAAAGAAADTPLRMDYCVEASGPGQYTYTFTLTLDNHDGSWFPGQGWGWIIYGDASGQSSPLRNFVGDPSYFPIGPFTDYSSSGGGHNGPTLGPVVQGPPNYPPNLWIPNAVGDFLRWGGTSTAYIGEGQLLWSNLMAGGGAGYTNFTAATHGTCNQVQGACCQADGSCIVVSSASCTNVGGIYRGNNSSCANANCPQPPTGACCRDSGCAVVTAAVCANTNGAYHGDNSTCATAGCAPATAYLETADVGDVPATAGVVTGNGPLSAIHGNFYRFADADMYRIRICDPANFSANIQYSGLGEISLYRLDGTGIAQRYSYNGPGTITNTYTSSLPAGDYDLAVAVFLNRPVDAGNAQLWQDHFDNGEYQPDGPGAANPIDHWDGGGGQDGNYNITLTGACFIPGGPPPCYANCDNSTTPPVANVADFTCFLQKFAAQDSYANCDNSTNPPVINVADFTCFLQKFAAGCP